jgi:hypothetical protein
MERLRLLKGRYIKNILIILVTIVITAGITYAAFGDKGKVLGSKFSVGSSDLKILANIIGGTGGENLVDELSGPSFTNIMPQWKQDYTLKLYNNGSSNIRVTSNANYLTINDPDELRSVIYVEPFLWNDENNDGTADTAELGDSLGKKTITKWKTEGYDLGSITQGNVQGILLRFSTDDLSETKQGKIGVFDFEFNSISE